MQSTEEMYLAAEKAAGHTLARWAVVVIVDTVTALIPGDCKGHAEKHDDQWDWDLNDVIAEMMDRIAALESEMAKLKTLPVINYSGIMREGE